MDTYRDRAASPALRRAAGEFPAVVVTGPRQCGKTTLVRRLFSESHVYCSLDDPTIRLQARQDPKLLLGRLGRPLIIDEIQYAPGLLHLIKAEVDAHRRHSGRFVLTGSQAFPLMQGVTESLAGRAAIFALSTLGLAEMREPLTAGAGSWVDALREASAPRPPLDECTSFLLRGGFPEIALDPHRDAELWHASYVQTYLERDVRDLRSIGDLTDFQRFIFAVAARVSGLANFSELSRDLGVNDKTVRSWLSVLEASGQVSIVRPYHRNLGKRVVKRPRIYFHDPGTLSHLLALREAEQVLGGIAAGPAFENAVFGALYRLFAHRGAIPRISYWRTSAGHEVDFVLEDGLRAIPVEAKLTATPTARDAHGIGKLLDLLGQTADRGYVVCLVEERTPLTGRVDAIPFGAF